jgi:dTDP-4-dehydrorhamnose 3,5-epimerase
MNLYLNTKFKDLKIIKNKYYKDVRGEILFGLVSNNIKRKFVYEYTSTSKKNVFRGFHYQTKRMQGKLITVLNGSIIDCVIDLRKKSKTYKKNFKILLSSQNKKSLYIPPGFAHGYYVRENNTVVNCKQTNFYSAKYERGIFWNDKNLKLKWKFKKPLLSIKDKNQPLLNH